jgi:hypothetical protein
MISTTSLNPLSVSNEKATPLLPTSERTIFWMPTLSPTWKWS